jgi:hypothetical protein
MRVRPWIIRLKRKDIGTVQYASPVLGMPQWCNGVCYLIKGISYIEHVITVREHPANNDKK